MSKAGAFVIGMHNKDEKKVKAIGLLPPSYANNAKYALNPYNVADKIALVVPNSFSFALIYLHPLLLVFPCIYLYITFKYELSRTLTHFHIILIKI